MNLLFILGSLIFNWHNLFFFLFNSPDTTTTSLFILIMKMLMFRSFLERIRLSLHLYQAFLTAGNDDCFISYSCLSHWSSSLEKVIKIGIIGENLSRSFCDNSSFDLQAILCWSVHITLYLYWIGIDSKLMFDRFSTIFKVEQDFW